ncbi:MAG: glycosyltransferase, partial [Verrucomicrobia bacterium]|nr:glycosyltransferase [Verrucomicrobiota bacterium]
MRSAIVHDWLISGIGGGEKVLEAIHRLFPSKIHTLVKSAKGLKGTYFEHLEIDASFIQKFPRAEKHYQSYLPFFPLAIERFDFTSYDLVISSSHCAAKGVITGPDQVHICYCHTPMRYAWDLTHEYLRQSKLDRGVRGLLAKLILHYLRGWDAHSAHRVDHFIANSRYIAKRIQKCYGRQAEVIYPPVNVHLFEEQHKKDNYYLTASRLVPYKRIDLIVEAFARMPEKQLVVIGDGPEWQKIKNKAGKNIELLGFQPEHVLKQHLHKAKGFVFAAVEDFGIAPVEAMAAGTPVIALDKGGVKETVVHGQTGLLYPEQSASSIIHAVQAFETMEFDAHTCRKRAEEFSVSHF